MKTKTILDEYFCNPNNVRDEQLLIGYSTRFVSPQEFYNLVEPEQKDTYITMKRIICNDGFSMSVQANRGAYCSPRITHRSEHTNIYDEYEVGFPSEKEDSLMEYAEDADTPTDTVYGYVPKEVIEQIIKKHGGIKPTD